MHNKILSLRYYQCSRNNTGIQGSPYMLSRQTFAAGSHVDLKATEVDREKQCKRNCITITNNQSIISSKSVDINQFSKECFKLFSKQTKN